MTALDLLDTAYSTYKSAPNEGNLGQLLTMSRDHAYRVTRDRDLAQNLVIYLMTDLNKVTIMTNFSSWLGGVIRNRQLDTFKVSNNHRNKHRSIDDMTENDTPSTKETESDFPRNMEALAADLEKGSIESELAESILDGKTLRQAAKELGIGETMARNRLRRLGSKLTKQGKTYAQK